MRCPKCGRGELRLCVERRFVEDYPLLDDGSGDYERMCERSLDRDGDSWIECDRWDCTYRAYVTEFDSAGRVFALWDDVFKTDMLFEDWKKRVEEVFL